LRSYKYSHHNRFHLLSCLRPHSGKQAELLLIHPEKITTNRPHADQYGFDLSLFFLGESATIRLVYRYEDEDTVGDETDYGANIYTIAVKGNVSAISEDISYEVKYQKNDKEYDNVTQSIGTKRSDDKDTFDVELSYRFNEHVELVGSYTYIDSNSNLSTADFDQNIYNLSLGLSY